MKRFTCLLILLVSIFSSAEAQQKKTIPAINVIAKERPADYEYLSAPDASGYRTPLKIPSAERSQQLKLPYPILFIHGLLENSALWLPTTSFMDSVYGFSFGGRFDFCLNSDADDNTANTNVYPAPGADISLFTANLTAGDYYYINFSVGNTGTVFPSIITPDYVKSNQASIVKQGIAVKLAINRVMQLTGRNKVILAGHSMGGLASREYLQNPAEWQSDGHTHTAKLVTIGTPHGGSNSTDYGLGAASGLDDKSEAVRDLRRTYLYSHDSGVYLFGGIEQQDITHMNDNTSLTGNDFYNVDINCDGSTGQTITGLNHKYIYTDVDYSCIIGECTGCIQDAGTGDGVVNDYSANLKNFYPNLNAHIYYYYAAALTEIHLSEPMQTYQNMQGLDEPGEFPLAYGIDFDTSYTGFITVQPANSNSDDYDDYKFSVPANSNVTVSINNIALGNLTARISDSLGTTFGTAVHSNGSTNINFTQLVPPGSYYLEISGTPTTLSYLNPYDFKLQRTAVVTGIESYEKLMNLMIYPNPAVNTLNITGIAGRTAIKLFDVLGKIIEEKETQSDVTLDTKQLPQGVYTFTAENANERMVKKIIIIK